MADTLIQGTTIIEDKRSAKGEVWSCSGSKFQGSNPDVNDVFIAAAQGGTFGSSANTIDINASVELPNNVKIIGVIVYGSNSTTTWNLQKSPLNAVTTTTIATAVTNTEDTSISNNIVNNSDSRYNLFVDDLISGAEIWGARIRYTI